MNNRKIPHKVFVARAQQVHGDKYQYISKYSGSRTKITIRCNGCDTTFFQRPYSHLEGSGCKKCDIQKRRKQNTLTHNQFINRVNEIHNFKYEYPEQYLHSQKEIAIICPQHGKFSQLANTHMLGGGCRNCANESRGGGYSNTYFEAKPERKNQTGWIYVLACSYKQENFIKVGITHSTQNRLNMYHYKGLSVKVLHLKETTLYKSFLLEQKILETLKPYKFYPNLLFEGRTECLKNKKTVLEKIVKMLTES